MLKNYIFSGKIIKYYLVYLRENKEGAVLDLECAIPLKKIRKILDFMFNIKN